MYEVVAEALEASGFELVPREDVKLGDSVVGAQSDDSEAMYAGEVVGSYSGYTRVLDKPGGAPRHIGATHVWRKPAPYKPGTYAEVEYGGTRTTGTLLRDGVCAVTATGTIVPLSDVKVVRALWEPGEDDPQLCAPMVAPSLGALKERPGWCVIDAEGDLWRWEAGKLLIRENWLDYFSPWLDEETADEYISSEGARWVLAPADKEE